MAKVTAKVMVTSNSTANGKNHIKSTVKCDGKSNALHY